MLEPVDEYNMDAGLPLPVQDVPDGNVPEHGSPESTQHLLRCFQKGCLAATLYPVRFAKTLVQIGYVPEELAAVSSIGGVPVKATPSIITYIECIYSNEGAVGLVRGGISYCLGSMLYSFVNHLIARHMYRNCRRSTKPSFYNQITDTLWTTVIPGAAAVVATQPLVVLSLRQISQFVGKENNYSSVFGMMYLLLPPGLFSLIAGILPRYIYLTVPALSAKLLVKIFDHCLVGHSDWHHPHSSEDVVSSAFYVHQDWIREVLRLTATYYVRDVLYPLNLLFVMSSIAHSGLVPGEYPFMPHGSWLSKLTHMAHHRQLWRKACVLSEVFTDHGESFFEY